MIRRLTTATIFAMCALGAGVATAARAAPTAGAAAALAEDLSSIIGSQGWSGDRWSVMVVSLDAGDTLFALNPDQGLKPASNMKLFTTAAALESLGPSYRYSTFVSARGTVEGGTITGDLLLYGTGDPTLSDRFYDSKTAVWEALADSLSALGIRRVTGDVVGDASYFEGRGVGEGWETDYVTHTYAASASALSFNDNVVTMRITPGDAEGSPPEIMMIPGGAAQIRNEATTSASGRSWIEVERASYDAPLVLRGEIRKGSSAVWRAVPVMDPARYAVSVLEEVLEEKGIVVEGQVRSVHSAAESPISGRTTFAPALEETPPIQVLVVHRSPPLQEILDVINQRSHNLYAESVLRTVGRVEYGEGSVRGGARAVAALLEAAGGDPSSIRVDDGSGLSSLNRSSARSFIQVLAHMRESPHWESYRASLPEAATSRGLRRMQQTPAAGNLRAKTGTIDRVSALSGYVRGRNGELLAFSILSNNVPSTWTAKRLEDRIGARLAALDRPVPPRATASRAAPARPSADTATDPATRPARADTAGQPADTIVATERPEPQPEPEEPEPRTYTVKSGDTMDAIAREHGVSVSALRAANPGVEPRRIRPGQVLRIPGGG